MKWRRKRAADFRGKGLSAMGRIDPAHFEPGQIAPLPAIPVRSKKGRTPQARRRRKERGRSCKKFKAKTVRLPAKSKTLTLPSPLGRERRASANYFLYPKTRHNQRFDRNSSAAQR